FFFFSSRRRHTRSDRDWSSDVCSSDLGSMTVCGVFCKESPALTTRPFLRPAPHGENTVSAFDICFRHICVAEVESVESRRPPKRSEERRVGKECGSRWGGEQ